MVGLPDIQHLFFRFGGNILRVGRLPHIQVFQPLISGVGVPLIGRSPDRHLANPEAGKKIVTGLASIVGYQDHIACLVTHAVEPMGQPAYAFVMVVMVGLDRK